MADPEAAKIKITTGTCACGRTWYYTGRATEAPPCSCGRKPSEDDQHRRNEQMRAGAKRRRVLEGKDAA